MSRFPLAATCLLAALAACKSTDRKAGVKDAETQAQGESINTPAYAAGNNMAVNQVIAALPTDTFDVDVGRALFPVTRDIVEAPSVTTLPDNIAQDYFSLIRDMGQYGTWLYQMRVHPERYSLAKRSDFDAASKLAREALIDLTDDDSRDPKETWRALRANNGVMGRAVANAQRGLRDMLETEGDDRAELANELKAKLAADRAALDALKAKFTPPPRNNSVYVADLAAAAGQDIVVNKRTGADAAAYCDSFNEQAPGSAFGKAAAELRGRSPSYVWRLPTVDEVTSARWAGRSMLKTMVGDAQNRMYVNAVRRTADGSAARVRADIGDLSDDTVAVNESAAEPAYTICVFGPNH